MGKLSYDQRIAIGDEASRLLEDKLFNQVVASVIADTLSEMVATPPGDVKVGVLHARLVGMEEFKGRLRALKSDSVLAKQELERQRS